MENLRQPHREMSQERLVKIYTENKPYGDKDLSKLMSF